MIEQILDAAKIANWGAKKVVTADIVGETMRAEGKSNIIIIGQGAARDVDGIRCATIQVGGWIIILVGCDQDTHTILLEELANYL